MRPFKLQSVLDYRKKRVDIAAKELQSCLEDRTALAAAKEKEESEMQRMCRQLQEAKHKALHILEILYCEDCTRFRKRCLEELEEKLASADAVVERKNRELVKARQEMRVLEILKEKKVEAASKVRKQKEMAFLDEVAVQRFGGRE